MYQQRLKQILKKLEERGLHQAIYCDPATIFYLTGRWIHPGERLLALYLNTDGNHRIFINELFTVPEDLGVEKVWFSDVQDGVQRIAEHTDHNAPIGIDKIWPARFLLRLMELGGASGYVNASDCVDSVRACKDEAEREKMREASRVNDRCMEEFRDLMHEGISEQEAAEQFKAIYQKHGAQDYSFAPLVSFGATAAIGHHEPDGTRLKPGDCILIDVGCVKDDYCSDMTRTFFYQKVSDRHREIYELVRRANEAAEAMIRPGVRFCDIDKAARDIIAAAGYGPNFTHRLGHSIGMECHEYGDVSEINTDPVRPGMVFSIEPGIYLEGEMGVRIEDLVLVTETGCEILNHYPKELTIIP